MQKGRSKRKIWIILVVVLIILLLLVGGYFGVKAYSKHKFNKELGIFQQGVNYGYTQAVLQIINVSDSCQPFPIYVGNETRELVSVTCYKTEP